MSETSTDRPAMRGMQTRTMLEDREFRELAPYGMKARDSLGREHAEDEHAYRTAYQRDRDRIIHCSAFRRLEYKTQVFVNTAGDYYRTRLTHTIEVAQIARTISRALALNEDLTECIALAHDIGHGPFGHSGEEVLHELTGSHGGFEHNRHALRIVDVLERKYPEFPGLNLTRELRDALLKHSPQPGDFRHPILETQVVDVADRIAYNAHDVDDGLTSGLLTESGLHETIRWKSASAAVAARYPELDAPRRRYHTVRMLIDSAVTDLIASSIDRLAQSGVGCADDARRTPERLVAPGSAMAEGQGDLSRYLHSAFYNHFQVKRMRVKGHRFIREMFQTLIDDPYQLPPRWKAWSEEEGLERAVGDYIAGMTDREALQQYRRLFHPNVGTLE